MYQNANMILKMNAFEPTICRISTKSTALLRLQGAPAPPSWELLITPDSKVYGVNMGLICGRQDPGGPHVGPMNFAIWDVLRRL